MQTKADQDGPRRSLDDYVAAWNASDADRIASLFAENGRYGEFGEGRVLCGRDQIAAHFRSMLAGVPDLRLGVSPQPVCMASRVFFKWTMRGTASDVFPSRLGAGTPFELHGATVLVFADGKIARAADSFELRNARNCSSRGFRSLANGLPSSRSFDGLDDPPEDSICYGE